MKEKILEHPLFPYGISLLILVVFVGATSGTVSRKVQKLPQFMAKSALSKVHFPEWMSKEGQKEMEAISLKENLLSNRLIPGLVATLKSLPWIKEVYEVRREFPARISLKISVRRPLAWAIIKGKRYGVDPEGFLIPHRYYKDLKLPQIKGLAGGWTEREREQIRQGAQVIYGLMEFQAKDLFDLAAVDMTNLNGTKDPRESEIVILCTSGAKIEWGRSHLSKRARISLEKKKTFLKRLLQVDPGLKKVEIARLHFAIGDEFPVIFREEKAEEKKGEKKVETNK